MSNSLPQVRDAAADLLDAYPAFAIDLDGVVWRGGRVLEGARDGLRAVGETGKPFILLTNNGAYRQIDVLDRLNGPGIQLAEEQVLSTSVVARQWIKDNGMEGVPAFIMAGPTVVEQFADLLDIRPLEMDQKAELVLVGRYEELNYLRLATAANSVRAGAEFLCLNQDPVMPVENGGVMPGTGTVVAAMQTATGRTATVLGKPERPMMTSAKRLIGDGALMIGDRLESDIAGAHSIGWDGALVLTGLSTLDAGMEPAPEFVLSSLGALAVDGARRSGS